MPTNLDVVNSSLKDLSAKHEETFTMSHPLLQKLWAGAEQHRLRSHSRLYDVITGDPGTLIGDRGGGALIAPPRRNVSRQAEEHPYLGIYAYNIPGKDLDEADGELDIVKIIRKYPELGLKGFKERFARQFARGAASAGTDPDDQGANGYTTLNSNQSYNPNGTSKTGLIQFTGRTASPDNGATGQTGTVHGLPLEDATTDATPGWYNQYGHIDSFSLDGNKTMRTTIGRANNQGADLEGNGVDLILSDEGSFQNYIESIDERIWITDVSNPASKYLNRKGVKFGVADWYEEPAIDCDDTTAFTSADARLGLAYIITSAYWEWFMLMNNPHFRGKKTSNFRVHEPIPLQDQYGYQFRVSVNGNLCCTNLRAQGAVTGGAQE